MPTLTPATPVADPIDVRLVWSEVRTVLDATFVYFDSDGIVVPGGARDLTIDLYNPSSAIRQLDATGKAGRYTGALLDLPGVPADSTQQMVGSQPKIFGLGSGATRARFTSPVEGVSPGGAVTVSIWVSVEAGFEVAT